MGKTYPKNFLARRWHSLFGLWMVVYIIEHLLTNSQAALPFSQDGGGFIHAVNTIHNLPYLKVIEICLIGVPFLYHGLSGIKYALSMKANSYTSRKNPSLTHYRRNHAYTWQRITAWVLLVGITLHVIQMRFLDYPSVAHGGVTRYVVRVTMDPGLTTVAARQNIELYDHTKIAQAIATYEERSKSLEMGLVELQDLKFEEDFVKALLKKRLKPGQVLAVSSEFGKVVLLTVRNTFKSVTMMILYTLFVIAAVYHGFRGLWSAAIVWGATLTVRSQKLMAWGAIALMSLFGLLGLAAIWLTYWVTLRF